MKKIGIIAVSFQILVLYCFIVSFCSTKILTPGISFHNDRTAKEDGFSPMESVDLFTIATKPVNVVNGFRHLPTFSFKNQVNDYLALRRAAESYLLNSRSEYIFFAKNMIVRLLPADLIFPFQYFW